MTTLIVACLIVIMIWLFILGGIIINHEIRIGKLEKDFSTNCVGFYEEV